jgi:hypothetical protein
MNQIPKYGIIFIFLFITLIVLLMFLNGSNTPRERDHIRILESSADLLEVQPHLSDLQLTDSPAPDETIYQVARAEGSAYLETGKPSVPVFNSWILIPNGKTAKIEVSPGEPAIIDGVNLAPVPAPKMDGSDLFVDRFIRDEDTYKSNRDFPGKLASLSDIQILRGHQCAILSLYPYQYNPLTKKFKIYPDLKVKVQFSGNQKPVSPYLYDESIEKFLKGFTLNGQELITPETRTFEPITGKYGWDYIIITAPKFTQAAAMLASWKQTEGYKVLVETYSDTTTASQIKSDLLSAYNNWEIPPKYVLILGDAEFIPTFYRSNHPANLMEIGGKTNTQGLTGTDLYYSTLQGRDPNNPDSDLVPDMAVGRLSVDSLEEAENRVVGIIEYEKNPTEKSSYYNNVAIISNFQDGGTAEFPGGSSVTLPSDGIEDKRYIQTSEDIAIFLSGNPINKNIIRIYYAEPQVNPQKWNTNIKQPLDDVINFDGPNTKVGGAIPGYLTRSNGYPWNADKNSIKSAIDDGCFLIIQIDHANRSGWGPPRFNSSDLLKIKNFDPKSRSFLLPVVWSISCEAGWFDDETDFPDKIESFDETYTESFSEYWERPSLYENEGLYGAVAVIAPTRITYGGRNAYFLMGMTDAIWPDFLPKDGATTSTREIGLVMNFGKMYMMKKTTLDSESIAEIEGYHCFGDPSMKIYTTNPLSTLRADLPTGDKLHSLFGPSEKDFKQYGTDK